MQKIKLGYSIPDGQKVFVNPSHLIVTGITQQSGKTTTLMGNHNANDQEIQNTYDHLVNSLI